MREVITTPIFSQPSATTISGSGTPSIETEMTQTSIDLVDKYFQRAPEYLSLSGGLVAVTGDGSNPAPRDEFSDILAAALKRSRR
jgi:hypothetical protein